MGTLLARLTAAGGYAVVAVIVLGCLLTLPYTLGAPAGSRIPRYEKTDVERALLPPSWSSHRPDERERVQALRDARGPLPPSIFGTDRLGRDLLVRCLAGGGVSLAVGIAAAAVAVTLGTAWGMLAGLGGPRTDALLMRTVDVLYGLPTILLVVLVAVAVDGLIDHARAARIDGGRGGALLAAIERREGWVNVITLLVAIGGVSWLTLARVIRGQTLSLREQAFMEAARAIGTPMRRQLRTHVLPNLSGPIIVYGTLAIPAAVLSESFLSFLGIGVREPVPSWGNLAADGLSELNIVRSRWWLLAWPCAMIAATLLGLNALGEAMRRRLDPRRRRS
jgi:ABC-type dipeptide/oligopeptide/nickel transport system permease subunit